MDFDLLVGKTAPFLGFGEVIPDATQIEWQFHKSANQIRRQVRNVFGVRLDSASTTPKELDDIVQELHESGWSSKTGNVELFTCDLGLLLAEATLELLGGRLIFRSPSNVVHCSIFYADQGVEAFPFHKALKCLTQEDGETMTFFVIGLGQVLQEQGLQMTDETKGRLPKARFSAIENRRP